MAFSQKLIRVTVQLAPNPGTNQPNVFAGTSAADTVTLSGSRTSVRIQNSGAPLYGSAQVKIWGLAPSIMNQLATLGLVFNIVPRNTITIQAGDVEPLATIFSGTIVAAYGDYSAQPDVPFTFECLSGLAQATAPAPVSSFTGKADVATIFSGIARQMSLGFVNHGVSVQLSNPYFKGPAAVQAQQCAEAADVNWGIFNGNSLEIWPKGGSRNTPSIALISPTTGLIAYPAYTQQGIIVKTEFNPLISFGALVNVQSSLLAALASFQAATNPFSFPTQWAVNKLDLALDSMLPHGDWMSVIYGYNPKYAKAIIAPP